jgi:hypothetical protein
VIIGPFSPEDWYTLRQLRVSIKHMKKVNPEKYSKAISKEEELYKDKLGHYLKAA